MANSAFGICGQAPSDYPEFARFLVEQGIDSISLNPDSVLKTLVDVATTEQDIELEREPCIAKLPPRIGGQTHHA